jgi:phage terminase large subunit-like protein
MLDSLVRLERLETQLRRWLPPSLEPEHVPEPRPPWREIARPEQLPPEGDWLIWLVLAGRGWGKTHTGAATIDEWARAEPGIRLHLVAPTAADARDVMAEGESGVCTLYPDVVYEPSKRRLSWPNGSLGILFSADEPKRLRGPQCHKAWADELAAWRYPETWDMLALGLRLGDTPQCVVTTTPRPTDIIRRLVSDERVRTVTGSTYDNAANLAPAFIDEVRRKYEGTRVGLQEVYARILDDAPGALWERGWFCRDRVSAAPSLVRVVVAIDPAVSVSESSSETGIVVCGVDAAGHGYVLDDLSGRYSPAEWAAKALAALERWQGDRIVAEANNGGDMVEHTIRTVQQHAPVRLVRASRGKRIRAEPIAALYEQRRIHHVGILPELEDQLCMWDASDGSPSPDRLDAMVWAFTDLIKPSVPDAYGAMRKGRRKLPKRRF